jgi:serine/threonine-protein kinase
MAPSHVAPVPTKAADRGVRQQLDRILASTTFQQVDRLKRFLQFIVMETLEHRGDELKEYVVGVQVFAKESSFDPRTDPLVRVQARRLRARLDRYYQAEGRHDDVIIELPKGGYTPSFRRRSGRSSARVSLGATFASRNTVAVLPFADQTPAQDLRFFCDGLSEEIIHGLTKFRSLRIIATDVADHTNGQTREAATRLGAAMLIYGSVRRSGERIRVTAQLVDSATGTYLWSDAFDTPTDDAIAAPEAIAQKILKTLEPELLESGEPRWTRRPTRNLAAHNLYLQGRYHLNQRTEEGLQKAVEFFQKAIVEDAQYALAHSGLSDAYALLAHYGVLAPTDVWSKAASSAASAVMLDPNSAEAHTSLAHMKATQDWDWVGSEREFQRAIGLDTRSPTAHHWYAMSCLVPLGRLDQARDEMVLAQSLDPVSSIIARDLAVIDLYRRDFEAALEQCDHTIELNPHFSPAYLTLGFVQEQLNDFDEAIAAVQRAVHLSPNTPRMHAALARVLGRSGKREPARKIFRELEAQSKQRYVSPFEFASMSLALGDVDASLKWMTQACQDRCFEVVALNVDPRLDPLRRDRRFAALILEVGLA